MNESLELEQVPPKHARLSEGQAKIVALEAEMRKLELEHGIAITPVHYFAQGLYAREITIPKGTVLTGKIHRFEHLNVISKGDISVMTEAGIRRIQAPAMIISQPGIKRVGYAHEETVWTTIHAYQGERDLEQVEKLLVVESFAEFERRIGEGEQTWPLLP